MGLILIGEFICQRWSRDGRRLSRHRAKNGICDAALNDALETLVRQGTQRTWRIGLYDNAGFTALSSADTMSSHAGWTEITDYTESTRPNWGPAAAASKICVNSSGIVFTMNATKTIKGLFITSDNTKGGTTGILWSTGNLDVVAQMQFGEVFTAFYRLTAEGR